MIVAGIDEAGYGPLLGPLVVGCCAFEVEGTINDPPCLWKLLRKLVGKKKSKNGKRIHVNDSKLVYSPGGGLKELERAVLSIWASCFELSGNLDDFVRCIARDCADDLAEYSWYRRRDGEKFPLMQEAMSVRIFAAALAAEMNRNGARCCHLAARVVPERKFNQMLSATRNKGSALFSTSAIHLDEMLKKFGDRNLLIFCDRQGGREHYGALLRLMFEQWSLEVVHEEEAHSEYRLLRGADVVRIVFTEKAEKQCLSVAVASMLSKYLREAMMARFNAFWKMQLPKLEPTAGYYSDGVRFLKDINSKRMEMGIADEQLIRSR
jgi:hypothetical protein